MEGNNTHAAPLAIGLILMVDSLLAILSQKLSWSMVSVITVTHMSSYSLPWPHDKSLCMPLTSEAGVALSRDIANEASQEEPLRFWMI